MSDYRDGIAVMDIKRKILMQYSTTCNNCGRTYMVDGNPGQTIHAICPFCGAKANVVTPPDRPVKRKSDKPMYLKITIWFLIAVTVLFIVMTILYLVFSGMSR